MIKMIQIFALILIITGCAGNNKPMNTRSIAISLIEKEYHADGRMIEYSQIDSADAALKGFTINRIYIDNSDSIRIEAFHLNYKKTTINKTIGHTVEPDLYKSFLTAGKVFTDDLEGDLKRINRAVAKFHGININQHYQYRDSITDMERKADSIACVEASALVK